MERESTSFGDWFKPEHAYREHLAYLELRYWSPEEDKKSGQTGGRHWSSIRLFLVEPTIPASGYVSLVQKFWIRKNGSQAPPKNLEKVS